jgi:hypothetical protein
VWSVPFVAAPPPLLIPIKSVMPRAMTIFQA